MEGWMDAQWLIFSSELFDPLLHITVALHTLSCFSIKLDKDTEYVLLLQ